MFKACVHWVVSVSLQQSVCVKTLHNIGKKNTNEHITKTTQSTQYTLSCVSVGTDAARYWNVMGYKTSLQS